MVGNRIPLDVMISDFSSIIFDYIIPTANFA